MSLVHLLFLAIYTICIVLWIKWKQYQVYLPPGPGFSSTSPAITRSRSTTTIELLSTRVTPPFIVSLTREVTSRQWERVLPAPPFSFDQVQTTYCSISDRAMTAIQPLSIRAVSFMTSFIPQLVTPGLYSRPWLLRHLMRWGWHTR